MKPEDKCYVCSHRVDRHDNSYGCKLCSCDKKKENLLKTKK